MVYSLILFLLLIYMGVSRRNLHSIARNTAHKFAFSADYIVQLAFIYNVKIVRADIINLEFELELFNIERNIHLLKLCKDNLLLNMKTYAPFYLCSANLTVTYSNDESSYEVKLVDNENRIWKGEYIDNNLL